MLLQIFLVQNIKPTCPPKKKETHLYHEFRQCFVELSLYFLLRTQGSFPAIKMFQDGKKCVFRTPTITVKNGKRRPGDVEIRNYLQDAAGCRSLVFDLSITHERFGSSTHVHQNGLLSQDLDASCCAAQDK